jgi:hypothetical protein
MFGGVAIAATWRRPMLDLFEGFFFIVNVSSEYRVPQVVEQAGTAKGQQTEAGERQKAKQHEEWLAPAQNILTQNL